MLHTIEDTHTHTDSIHLNFILHAAPNPSHLNQYFKNTHQRDDFNFGNLNEMSMSTTTLTMDFNFFTLLLYRNRKIYKCLLLCAFLCVLQLACGSGFNKLMMLNLSSNWQSSFCCCFLFLFTVNALHHQTHMKLVFTKKKKKTVEHAILLFYYYLFLLLLFLLVTHTLVLPPAPQVSW